MIKLTILHTNDAFEVPTIMPEVLEDYLTRHSPVRQPHAKRLLGAET